MKETGLTHLPCHPLSLSPDPLLPFSPIAFNCFFCVLSSGLEFLPRILFPSIRNYLSSHVVADYFNKYRNFLNVEINCTQNQFVAKLFLKRHRSAKIKAKVSSGNGNKPKWSFCLERYLLPFPSRGVRRG